MTEDDIGDFQTISNIDSFRNIMQVSEYWWEFPLFCEAVSIRLGKQDINRTFLVMDLAQDFIHSSFGLSPSAGLPSYPAPSAAALLLVRLTDSLALKIGFWDALGDGTNWGFTGNEITLLIHEWEYRYALFDGRLPGAFDFGMAYQSGGDFRGLQIPWSYTAPGPK